MTSIPRRPPGPPLRSPPPSSLLIGIPAFHLSAQKTADRPAVPVVSAESGRLPNGQMVTPAGRQVELPELRPHVLALSPDGQSSWSLPAARKKSSPSTRSRARSPAHPSAPGAARISAGRKSPRTTSPSPMTRGSLSYTGLVFSPDGRRLYLSNVQWQHSRFSTSTRRGDYRIVSFLLPPANAPRPRAEEIPSGIAVSPDGAKLYIGPQFVGEAGANSRPPTGRMLRALDVRLRSLRRRPGPRARLRQQLGRAPPPARRREPARPAAHPGQGGPQDGNRRQRLGQRSST